MISGLERIKTRRVWLVPDFTVWGLADLGQADYLVHETVNATSTVLFGSTGIGQAEQEVSFSDLTDHRGNSLPAAISSPCVFPRAKDRHSAYIVGPESVGKFKIARDPEAPSAVSVDLLIVEMGE
ncbi:MAG: hypothetical protein JSU65_07485 [Candidatus Zixiibacteriota bacterium]|nr:MAG: hypothetical protein JSU65_07485 [candidate division Zixibacteria bacterium]